MFFRQDKIKRNNQAPACAVIQLIGSLSPLSSVKFYVYSPSLKVGEEFKYLLSFYSVRSNPF